MLTAQFLFALSSSIAILLDFLIDSVRPSSLLSLATASIAFDGSQEDVKKVGASQMYDSSAITCHFTLSHLFLVQHGRPITAPKLVYEYRLAGSFIVFRCDR
ncbi:unnamed protein product [Cylicocyclus nassatus]|uniref:Secreted protein n=1 Tax=Cylicocyclus nassatus TaxID=53992 RepID=A0AA36DRZ7_CYLNA|nr:unnamed protein product [Cylicocyclus nassatus]